MNSLGLSGQFFFPVRRVQGRPRRRISDFCYIREPRVAPSGLPFSGREICPQRTQQSAPIFNHVRRMGIQQLACRQSRQTRPHIQENFTFDGGIRYSKREHPQSFLDKDSNRRRDIPVIFAQFLEVSRELAPGNSSKINEFDTQCSPLRSEEGPVSFFVDSLRKSCFVVYSGCTREKPSLLICFCAA